MLWDLRHRACGRCRTHKAGCVVSRPGDVADIVGFHFVIFFLVFGFCFARVSPSHDSRKSQKRFCVNKYFSFFEKSFLGG
jgi:hypothetical protein